MTSYTLRDRSASRHLSDAELRPTTGPGTMDEEGFLSYHAAEYTMSPPTTIGPFSDYDRQEVLLATERQVWRLLLLQQPDWDSYGARPIHPVAVYRATRLLLSLIEHEVPAPRLSPLVDGGVRLEWRGRWGEVYIDVPAENEPAGYFIDEETQGEWEGPLAEAPGRMLELLTDLRGER